MTTEARVLAAGCVLVGLLASGCGRGAGGFACPTEFTPVGKTNAELEKANIATIPRQEATTKANVLAAERKSRRFIKQNYPNVLDVGVGRGWGVNYTQDPYGKITFHRRPDYMVVVVVRSRGDCPDPERGTLFVFGNDGLRAPVQFLYREKA